MTQAQTRCHESYAFLEMTHVQLSIEITTCMIILIVGLVSIRRIYSHG